MAILIATCHPVPEAVNGDPNAGRLDTFKELYATNNSNGSISSPCAPDKISAPVDISPQVLPYPCLSIPVSEIASLINKKPGVLGKTDFSVLLTKECMKVDTPAGLTFVIGAAINKDETGADYTKDFRLPLPTEISGMDGIEEKLGGLDLPNSIKLPDYTLPEDKALLVAKLTLYGGQLHLKLVNIAGIMTENGQQFLSTLGDEARDHMSAAMKIDGPGVYGIYYASKAIAFISGQVLKSDIPVPGAVVTGTGSPFLSRADSGGAYSIANFQGQAGLSAYDIQSFARGELFFKIEPAGNTNPTTQKPPETPAIISEIPTLKGTLNLENANINIVAAGNTAINQDNMDFEKGDLSGWVTTGHTQIEKTLMAKIFPSSSGKAYAFISTGEGSDDNFRSTISREMMVPKGITQMHIDYNILTQEYPNWMDTPYSDMFYVLTAGTKDFLHHETVKDNAGKWQPFKEVIGNVALSKPEEDTDVAGLFGGIVGFRRKTLDISHCSGDKAVFVFGVSDVGDSGFDTAVVIDKVVFE